MDETSYVEIKMQHYIDLLRDSTELAALRRIITEKANDYAGLSYQELQNVYTMLWGTEKSQGVPER